MAAARLCLHLERANFVSYTTAVSRAIAGKSRAFESCWSWLLGRRFGESRATGKEHESAIFSNATGDAVPARGTTGSPSLAEGLTL